MPAKTSTLANRDLRKLQPKLRMIRNGDGHWADILKGLEHHGKLSAQGDIHVNVLKVQHHGSEHNLNAKFCQAVIADDYIICGNGAHENPDLDVLQTVVDSRLGTPAKRSQSGAEWWRRRELNPRPKQKNQPRLHA